MVGILLSFASLVARIAIGANALQVVIMLGFSLIVLLIGVVIFIVSAKFGLIKRSPIVQDKTAVPVNNAEMTKEEKKLMGKIGFAHTVFKPSGKFSINGQMYSGNSLDEYIEKGSRIKVVGMKNGVFVVKKM